MSRPLVTGGRTYANRVFVFFTLADLHAHDPVECVIQGGATGADQHAREWAGANSIPVETYPARWDDLDAPGARIRMNRRGEPYNAMAGPQRNAEMLWASCPTHVIAFPGRRGTDDMVGKAEAAIRRGHAVRLVDLRGERRRRVGVIIPCFLEYPVNPRSTPPQ